MTQLDICQIKSLECDLPAVGVAFQLLFGQTQCMTSTDWQFRLIISRYIFFMVFLKGRRKTLHLLCANQQKGGSLYTGLTCAKLPFFQDNSVLHNTCSCSGQKWYYLTSLAENKVLKTK